MKALKKSFNTNISLFCHWENGLYYYLQTGMDLGFCDVVCRGPSSQGYGFSSGHVWMWDLDCEESWVLKNWYFWTVVLEKTLESPLHCKEIQPVHSKGDQFWMFIGRTDAKAKTPILWPPHAELTHWKRLWCWEGLGAGGEGDNRGWDGWMASLTRWTWFEWTLGVGDVQGGLACCDIWGCKESDTTEWLNWIELMQNKGPL